MKHQPAAASEVFQTNEVSANRSVSWVLLCFAFIQTVTFIASLNGSIILGYRYVILLMAVMTVLQLGIGILGLSITKYHPWFKWVLMMTFVVTACALFFAFGHYAAFFLILGPLVSSRYFKLRFTIWISVINYLLYLLSCHLNVEFEQLMDQVKMQHALTGITWANTSELFAYEILMHTMEFAVVIFISISVVRSGIKVSRESSQLASRVNSLDTELEVGSQIQQSILPAVTFNESDGRIGLHATMKPAKEVAGDFYDYFMPDTDHIVTLVADVSDKGLPAAMFMMSAKSEIRSAVYSCKDLKTAMQLANSHLTQNNSMGMFVTVWIGCTDLRTGRCDYVNAGHPYPLVRHSDGSVSWIENTPNKFLGVFDKYEPRMESFMMQPGDTLLLYTDGVTDCVDSAGSMFGTPRVADVAAATSGDLCTAVLDACTRFAGNADQFDDTTLLAMDLHDTGFCVDAATGSIPYVIDVVNSVLTDCPDNARRAIDTAIDEVCSNICDYSGSDSIFVRILSPGVIEIADSGKPFNPLEQNTDETPVATENGGMGIFLTMQLMDSVKYRYENGRNILTLIKNWHNSELRQSEEA